jgi:hypothetical protein
MPDHVTEVYLKLKPGMTQMSDDVWCYHRQGANPQPGTEGAVCMSTKDMLKIANQHTIYAQVETGHLFNSPTAPVGTSYVFTTTNNPTACVPQPK